MMATFVQLPRPLWLQTKNFLKKNIPPKGGPTGNQYTWGNSLKKHPSIGKPGRNPESRMKEVNHESKQLGSLYQARRWPYGHKKM